MEEPFYDLRILKKELTFTFESRGKRIITKSVIFQKLEMGDYFQMALVDILENGSFDDSTVSDNGDKNKVLSTVFQILSYFLSLYSDSTVLFAGSSPSRTRLYQIAISIEFEKATQIFNTLGFYGDSFEPFIKNKSYEAFAISKK